MSADLREEELVEVGEPHPAAADVELDVAARLAGMATAAAGRAREAGAARVAGW